MNVIVHKRIIIDYDTWEPQQLLVRSEEDKLLVDLKTKVLLAHAGNIHTKLEEVENGNK